MSWSKTIHAPLCAVLLAFAGCAGNAGGMMDSDGSSGSDAFGNASGGTGAPAIQNGTNTPSSGAGSGGRNAAGSGGSAAPGSGMRAGSGGSVASGSGGSPASSGSGGAPSSGGSSGSGGMAGSAGMGGSNDDPFGLADAGLFGPDPDPNAPPPAAGQCADAVCFDVFDCTLWHADLVGVCNFTDCVDFVCK